MKRVILAILFATAAAAQIDGGAGIVYGTDHAFAIQAPEGWVLDNTSGKGHGLCAVFYKEGESWQSADVVMYANTASKRVEDHRTLEQLMEYDAAQFKSRAPDIRITSAASIRGAAVRHFMPDEYGNHEAVAYIDEEFIVVMLVLSARTKEGFERAYPAFAELVESYQFLTSDVTFGVR